MQNSRSATDQNKREDTRNTLSKNKIHPYKTIVRGNKEVDFLNSSIALLSSLQPDAIKDSKKSNIKNSFFITLTSHCFKS